MKPSLAPPAAAVDSADFGRAADQEGPAVLALRTQLATVRMRVDARGLALGVLAALALGFALSWAEKFLVPLLLGVLIAYTLNPLVSWLEAIRIARVAGTVIVMASVLTALVLGAYSLRGEMQTIVEQLPEAASKVSTAIGRARIGQLGNFLWEGSVGVLGAAGQTAMVVFLVFFLVLGGDEFKRKLVQLTGPSLSSKKITVHILDDINGSIQKFMFMLLTTNVLVALLSWMAFRWIGLENAGAWAVAAGLLHMVPYLGPGVTAAATSMAAFMQFESFSTALLTAGASVAIATVVGTFVTTWMIGRIARMNSAAIFISLLFWGWLWGVWGMLLSIPIIVIVKVVSQHVEQLHPVAELLGD